MSTYQLEQTGQQVQNILNEAPQTKSDLQSEITRATGKEGELAQAIADEKTRAEGIEGGLRTDLDAEIQRATDKDVVLENAIGAEETRAEGVEGALRDDVDAIDAVIPNQASSSNQLADKAFVNSSIATNTADFKGTYNSLEQLETEVTDANANDYAFVIGTDQTGNTVYNRYKYVEGTGWVFEYALNNSSFTASQWAAINSAITAALVAKLTGLPTAEALTTSLNDLLTAIGAEKTRAELIEAGLRTDVNANAGAIVTEKNRAEGVEGTLTNGLTGEILNRSNADTALGLRIDGEATLRENADSALQGDIDDINDLIPTQASESNQLADKEFVNSSIATNTAEFKGTYNSLAELEAVTGANANDYGFVISTDEAGNTVYNRYKYVEGTGWVFEYALNNSSFTASQWAAINSGITAALVAKLSALPTNDALTAALSAITDVIPTAASSSNKLIDAAQFVAALATKQNTLTFDSTPTANSNNPVTSQGIKNSIDALDAAKADKATTLAGYGIEDAYTKTEVNGLVSTPHQNYVTVATYASLPATGSADTIYRVSSYDGANSQVDNTVYSEYAWNGSAYVFLCVKSQIDEVFDITVYNSNTKYADLTAALGTDGANIPQSLRRGGMSVKYVQTYDNKYVQARCMAQSFTTDTTQWAIAEEGVYVDNPEFVYVKTDKDGKILWAIKTDGGIYYGAGVPQQVIDYVEEKIADLSLDEYEDIVAFLNGLEEGDKTLQELLNKKVDKEDGKSLIDEEYASTKSTIDNPEFLDVTLDEEDKVLEGIQVNGTKVIGGDLNIGGSTNISRDIKVLGSMEVSGVSYKVIENLEYIAAWLDKDNKVVFGFKTDGKTYVGDADFLIDIKNNQKAINEIKSYLANFDNLDIDALSSITAVDNPKYIEAKTDSEGKLLAGRTSDGAAFENVGFSTPKVSIDGTTAENIEDPEGRIGIVLDGENKVLSYRKEDGTKVEELLEVHDISFSSKAATQVKQVVEDTVGRKKWALPKYGRVNIKEETFYLTANEGYSDKNGVVCIQMYDDTDANAAQLMTLSYYYVKSTLTPKGDGTYDRTSVGENSIKLNFWPGKEVVKDNGNYYVKSLTKVGDKIYITSTLDKTDVGGTTVYNVNGNSVAVDVDLEMEDQQTLKKAIQVTQIVDVPPYKAWTVNKQLEHYCVADIDFGYYYSKENVAISIKYQGSGSLTHRKRGLRLTFYKNNTYAKKDKVKIGEMVRLSGYNMKSYGTDNTRIKDPIASNVLREVWETNGDKAFPWSNDSVPYNGATGFIKSFLIETWFGEEFFGIQNFGLKKDEKNYMLDGDDDSSGIFVSGRYYSPTAWVTMSHTTFEDEMMDEMSQETADALDVLGTNIQAYINGTIDIDGTDVPYTTTMLEEHIDIRSWIDYWIGIQIFQLWDSNVHNMILSTRSDKAKFYAFFYDLDQSCQLSYNVDMIENLRSRNQDISFWERFLDDYKDSIINRYMELRKTVLSDGNFESTFRSYISNIPSDAIDKELQRYGIGNPDTFEQVLIMLERRMDLLDKNYFFL